MAFASRDMQDHGLIKFFNEADRYNPGRRTEVRNRFQWILKFGPTAMREIMPGIDMMANDVGFFIKSTDLPRITLETQTLNQYNIRRNVTTHMSYEPLTMTFYDTQHNIFQRFMEHYMNYKFKNFEKAENVEKPFTLGPGIAPEFGLKKIPFKDAGQVTPLLNDNFFTDITISKIMSSAHRLRNVIEVTPRQYHQTTLFNPKIVDLSQDQLDYADGSSPLTWTVTWRYESYRYATQDDNLVRRYPEADGLLYPYKSEEDWKHGLRGNSYDDYLSKDRMPERNNPMRQPLPGV